MKRLVLLVAIACVGLASTLVAQTTGRKVTILTKKGEVVEGTLKSLTDSDVTIEIAGQPVKLPVDSIDYVSFVGKVSGGGSGPAPGSIIDAAFASLRDLDLATQTAMLRPQYADKLQAVMPAVKAFVNDGPVDEWADVKIALTSAAATYEAALGLDAWPNAGSLIRSAAEKTRYADTLRAMPDAKTHEESSKEKPIQIGETVNGRLGFGDQRLTLLGRFDEKGESFADVYSFTVSSRRQVVTIEVAAVPCGSRVALYGDPISIARPIDTDNPTGGKPAVIKNRTLDPGTYHFFAACDPGMVGTYTASIK